jgi:hypothetical protein
MKRAVQLQTDLQTAPPTSTSGFDDFFAEYRRRGDERRSAAALREAAHRVLAGA